MLDEVKSWKGHCTRNLRGSDRVEFPDHTKTSPTTGGGTAGLRQPGSIQCIHHVLHVQLEGDQGWTVGFGDAVSTLQAPVRD